MLTQTVILCNSALLIHGSSFTVMLYEFKDGLTRYFSSLGDKARVKDLSELMEFNKKDSIELRYFDQHLLKLAHEKGTLHDKEYQDALATMLKATRDHGTTTNKQMIFFINGWGNGYRIY